MHVVFSVERQIKVEHSRYVFDVEATCGHIGTHQQIHRTALEGFKRLQAFVLRFVAVQGSGFEAFTLQRPRQAGAAQLAVHKNEGLLQTALAQHVVDGPAFVFVRYTNEALLYRRGRGIGTRHLDGDRVLQVAVGQSFDFR
jgi:hypothetical protein